MTSNHLIRVRFPYEAYGYVAKRRCNGLLIRLRQVQLLSYPCPRSSMDRPGGYEPSNARSTRAGDTVAVAERAMHRIVAPEYAGSTPVSHLIAVG